MSFAGSHFVRWIARCAITQVSFANLGHPRLWLKGMSGVGAVRCVGILRFAQNDRLWSYELRLLRMTVFDRMSFAGSHTLRATDRALRDALRLASRIWGILLCLV